MNKSKQPKVEFIDTITYGDQIKALVEYYTGTSIGTFCLEMAIEKIKANNKKLAELKEVLLEDN